MGGVSRWDLDQTERDAAPTCSSSGMAQQAPFDRSSGRGLELAGDDAVVAQERFALMSTRL
jgi:hypothetical protein